MPDAIEHRLAENLRRWRESGQPRAWCDSRQGQWTDDDWLALVGSLWWSEFWPMNVADARAVLEDYARPCNLRRWREAGLPLDWIVARGGAWGHDDWLALLDSLRASMYWPMDEAAVGAVLEETRLRWRNLRRWKETGVPQRWVESRQGQWEHADWLDLAASLRQSDYWPLDLPSVGQLLDEFRQSFHNLLRWQMDGHARRWVELRQGVWDHDGWLALMTALRHSEFWPLDPVSVARVVDEMRREWWNLKRWRDAGFARRWVETMGGQWNHDDWLALLASLRAAGYWPIDPSSLGRALELARDEWRNLQRWQQSQAPRQWVNAHEGKWNSADQQALLQALWQSDYWPLDVRAVSGLLECYAREYANLARWEAAGEAIQWVASHDGAWNHADWTSLLDELRQSDYWPLAPDAVGAALERVRSERILERAILPMQVWPFRGRQAA